jgi:hypothetical protein
VGRIDGLKGFNDVEDLEVLRFASAAFAAREHRASSKSPDSGGANDVAAWLRRLVIDLAVRMRV